MSNDPLIDGPVIEPPHVETETDGQTTSVTARRAPTDPLEAARRRVQAAEKSVADAQHRLATALQRCRDALTELAALERPARPDGAGERDLVELRREAKANDRFIGQTEPPRIRRRPKPRPLLFEARK